MKRFRFPLQGLLRVRDLKQKQVMAEMAPVMERVNTQQNIVERSEREYREEMERFAVSQGTGATFNIDHYRMFDRYVDRLEGEKAEAHRRLEELRPELEAVTAKLVEARKEKRIVELLREKHLERYNEGLRRVERKELEEINRLAFEPGTEEAAYGMERPPELEKPESVEDVDTAEDAVEDLRTREKRRWSEYLKQAGLTEEQVRRAIGH